MTQKTIIIRNGNTRWLYNVAIRTNEDILKWIEKIRDIPFFQEEEIGFYNIHHYNAVAALPAKADREAIINMLNTNEIVWLYVKGNYSMVPTVFTITLSSVSTPSYFSFEVASDHADMLPELEDMVDIYCREEAASGDNNGDIDAENEDE